MTLSDVDLDSLPNQRVVLHDVSWATLEALLDDLETSRQHLRLAYEDGTLELMTRSREHEQIKTILGRMLELLTFERNIPMLSYGSTTLRRKDRRRAVEPDECYYVTHEQAVRAKKDCDLVRDPPPDLALEVDITSSSLRRLRVYARLGVGEVWRWNGKAVVVHLLAATGAYEESNRSRLFPWLPVTELARFIERRSELDETSLMHAFRDWLRSLPSSPPAT
jgi:Uma2 family endonuclease